MDILQFQKTWSPTDWDWTTTSSFTTLSEDEPLSAHRVLSDRKILSEVFQSLSHLPHVLSCAARVNKLWFEVSTDVVWEDVPAGGIRPILFTIPEYHESRVRGGPYLSHFEADIGRSGKAIPHQPTDSPKLDPIHDCFRAAYEDPSC